MTKPVVHPPESAITAIPAGTAGQAYRDRHRADLASRAVSRHQYLDRWRGWPG